MEKNEIENEAKNVISIIRESINIDESDRTYKAIEMGLNKFHKFLIVVLSKLPAELENNPTIKYGLKIAADLTVRLVKFFFKFFYVAIRKPKVWELIWDSCKKTWNENADNGITTQIYAFSKKFLAYVCELCVQCFIKSLEASDLVLKEEEKTELANVLFNSEEINEINENFKLPISN